jgi:magnesium transporter
MGDILAVVRQEANEDIMKLAGAEHVHPVHAPFFDRLKARMPWLGAAMALELMIAWIMKGYESAGTLQHLALAYFIPVIMAMGGSVGLQSATMVVRGLATGELTVKKGFRVVVSEVRVGLTIGLLAGIVTGAMAYLMASHIPFRLGMIVFASMTISITVAATVGAFTPLLLERMNIDPAVASGPFITALNDVVNVTIYLTMATVFILKMS